MIPMSIFSLNRSRKKRKILLQSMFLIHRIHRSFKMSLLRKLSSKLFTMIISRYVVTGVNDTQCGLKGFKADAANKLFSRLHIKGFAFDVELLYLSYKYELEIKRIPVTFEGNNFSMVLHFQDLKQFKTVNDRLNELQDHPDFAKILEKELAKKTNEFKNIIKKCQTKMTRIRCQHSILQLGLMGFRQMGDRAILFL